MRQKIKMMLVFAIILPAMSMAQHHDHEVKDVEVQPLLSQALRLREALSFLGSSLSDEDEKRLEALRDKPHDNQTTKSIQEIFDPYCLAIVQINAEGRVKLDRGTAKTKLMQGGWTSFLVKVHNESGGTAELNVESPNALKAQHSPSFDPVVKPENVLTKGQVLNRFLDIQMYRNKQILTNISCLKLE